MDRHVLQAQPNYCVPACIVMVEAWQGVLRSSPDDRQHELFAALNVNGLCALEDAASLVENEGVGEPDVDQAKQVMLLEQLIRADRRAIVTCWPAKLGPLLAVRDASSPHGLLPGVDVPHHAVYVFGVMRASFEIFDPWHHATNQPFRLSRVELARAWTGMMLIAKK